MTKDLLMIPESLGAAAQHFVSLAEDAAALRARMRQQWARLDSGWQSYARDNADAYFAETMKALERDETMLRQRGDALLRSLARLAAGDSAAAGLFDGKTEPGAGAPLTPDLDPLAGLAPALGGLRSGAPVISPGDTPIDAIARPGGTGALPAPPPVPAPPGVKISGVERTIVPEVCDLDGHCNAITAQLSASFKPTIQPVTVVVGTSGDVRALEISLGKLGDIPLGTLQIGPGGIEYTFAALAREVVTYTLASGVVISVLAEPTVGSKPYNGQPATYVGEKFSVVVKDPNTGVTSKGSVAVRVYSYDKPQAAPQPAPGSPLRNVPQPPAKDAPAPEFPAPEFPAPTPPSGAPGIPPVIAPGLLG